MIRKKLLLSVIGALLLIGSTLGLMSSAAAATAVSSSLLVDGKAVPLSVSPQVIKGTLYVPYGNVVSALGGQAQWDSATRTVTAAKGTIKVTTTVGSKTAYINGEKATLQTAPMTVNGTTLVPLRFIAEAFGAWVKWDSAKKQAVINTSVTVQTSGGPLTLTKRPERIVTLASSDTEIVYALGAEVVGRPTSTGGVVIPPQAASAKEVGSAHGINFEVLASLKPDLVIGSPSLQPHVATVEQLGAKFLLNSHTYVSEIKNSINLYAKVLGKEDQAAKLIKQFERDIDAAVKTKPAKAPKALIVYGAPGTFLLALPTSYPGHFLELAGGTNVASDFPQVKGMPQYAEFSLERIIAANPDVIYLITHGDPSAVMESFRKELESNPAWNGLSAVKNDQFAVLPTLFAANPGLRAPEAIKYLNESLLKVKL